MLKMGVGVGWGGGVGLYCQKILTEHGIVCNLSIGHDTSSKTQCIFDMVANRTEC